MSKNIRTEAVDHLFEAILCLKDKEECYTFFEDADEEDKDFLKTFSFICLLSFDVYMKKMIIEKIIDTMVPNDSPKKGKKPSKKE